MYGVQKSKGQKIYADFMIDFTLFDKALKIG